MNDESTDIGLFGIKWFPLNHLYFFIWQQWLLLATNQSEHWIHWRLQYLNEQLKLFNWSIFHAPVFYQFLPVVGKKITYPDIAGTGFYENFAAFACFVIFVTNPNLSALVKNHCFLYGNFWPGNGWFLLRAWNIGSSFIMS